MDSRARPLDWTLIPHARILKNGLVEHTKPEKLLLLLFYCLATVSTD